MDKQQLVFGAHGVIGLGLLAFGAYRVSAGNVVPGALNVAMAVVVVGVGYYISRLTA